MFLYVPCDFPLLNLTRPSLSLFPRLWGRSLYVASRNASTITPKIPTGHSRKLFHRLSRFSASDLSNCKPVAGTRFSLPPRFFAFTRNLAANAKKSRSGHTGSLIHLILDIRSEFSCYLKNLLFLASPLGTLLVQVISYVMMN